MTNKTERKVSVQVWDMPTRLFHWLLAGLVGVSFLSAEFGRMDLHQKSGLAILALVLFRLIWGFVGGTHARFADFVKPPSKAIDYLKKGGFSIGHNPLGGLMVLALLAVLPLQVGLGLFGNDDISYEAPFYKFVSKSLSDSMTGLHAGLSNILLAMIALHVAAAFFYLIVKRDNLIRPMVTGMKALPESLAQHRAKMGHPLLAAVLIVACGMAAWGLLFL